MKSFAQHRAGFVRKPLIGALVAIWGLAGALPAQAESEIEALKRELAEQRLLIQSLQAQQERTQELVNRLPAPHRDPDRRTNRDAQHKAHCQSREAHEARNHKRTVVERMIVLGFEHRGERLNDMTWRGKNPWPPAD